MSKVGFGLKKLLKFVPNKSEKLEIKMNAFTGLLMPMGNVIGIFTRGCHCIEMVSSGENELKLRIVDEIKIEI